MKLYTKETFLEIKNTIFDNIDIETEPYLKELSTRSILTYNDLVNIYNCTSLWKLNEDETLLIMSQRAPWTDGECQVVMLYMDIVKRYEMKSNRIVFEELDEILAKRTPQSIQFQYYQLKKRDDFSVEKLEETFETPPVEPVKQKEEHSEDLLDMVVGFVDNVEKVNVDVQAFFKGLVTLSNHAVENNKDKIDDLEGQVEFYKQELANEKEKNEKLQEDVAKLIVDFDKLKYEVEYFNSLSGKQKLQQLNNYNKNLKVMIDKFGGVISVAINKDII